MSDAPSSSPQKSIHHFGRLELHLRAGAQGQHGRQAQLQAGMRACGGHGLGGWGEHDRNKRLRVLGP